MRAITMLGNSRSSAGPAEALENRQSMLSFRMERNGCSATVATSLFPPLSQHLYVRVHVLAIYKSSRSFKGQEFDRYNSHILRFLCVFIFMTTNSLCVDCDAIETVHVEEFEDSNILLNA
jgi:hypothetical protein